MLCRMWGLPGPEMEPVSPALVGGLFTTETSGKALHLVYFDLKQDHSAFWTSLSTAGKWTGHSR